MNNSMTPGSVTSEMKSTGLYEPLATDVRQDSSVVEASDPLGYRLGRLDDTVMQATTHLAGEFTEDEKRGGRAEANA